MSEDINTLREAIKQRYKTYHLLDRDRFPDLIYNTNRANYEPLRASFAEEFFVVRGMDRASPTIHIPSTNTLALLFTDDSYTPGKKILNTCQSYAGSVGEGTSIHLTAEQTDAKHRVFHNFPSSNWANKKHTALGSLLVLLILLAVGYEFHPLAKLEKDRPRASRLTISRPTHNEVVPREVIAEGKVSGADTVWVFVGSKTGGYWAQRPIPVNTDGTWKGPILIGHFTNLDTGVRFQLRAIVHPLKPLKEEDYFRPWPEAELSSATVEVVKGTSHR